MKIETEEETDPDFPMRISGLAGAEKLAEATLTAPTSRSTPILFTRSDLQKSAATAKVRTLYTAPSSRVAARMSGSITLVIPRGNGEFGQLYVAVFRLEAAQMITVPSEATIAAGLEAMLNALVDPLNVKGTRKATQPVAIPQRDVLVDALFTTHTTPTEQMTVPHTFARKIRFWFNPGDRILVAAVYKRYSPDSWGQFFGTTAETFPGIFVFPDVSYTVKK